MKLLGIGTCCGYIRSPGEPAGCLEVCIIKFGSRNVGEAAAKNGKLTERSEKIKEIHRITE